MGDRAVIVLKSNDEYSPVAFLNWDAPQVQNYVNRLQEVMSSRGCKDLEYAFARLCGIIHNDIDGSLSFGVWNLEKTSVPDFEKMSPGDGGVFVVDIKDYSIATYGGYGIDPSKHRPTRDVGEADRTARRKTSACTP